MNLAKLNRFKRFGLVAVTAIILVMLLSSLISVLVDPSSILAPELENFAPETVSDGEIVASGEHFNAFRISTHKSGESTGIGGFIYDEYDHDKVKLSVKWITGIKLLSASKVKDATLDLNIESTLESGDAKIVIIRDREIVEYVDLGQSVNLSYEVSGEHTYYVKLLCADAKLTASATRDITQK